MIILFLLAAAPTAAPIDECADPQTQTDMTICAGRDFADADAALNRQWTATVAIAREDDRSLDRATDKRPGYYVTLLAGQRAWIRFRDAHCTSEGYGARGGSMEPMLYNACRAELTRLRTQQLANLAEKH